MPTLTQSNLRELHAHAHECLDIVFRHGAALPFPLLTQEISGAPHQSVRNQMVHLLMAEAFWVSNLQNRILDEPGPEDFSSMDQLLAEKRRIKAETIAYLDSLDEATLNKTFAALPKSWIGPLRSPAYILLHVMTHAFHHKGQICMMYRILGHPTSDTDMQGPEIKLAETSQ